MSVHRRPAGRRSRGASPRRLTLHAGERSQARELRLGLDPPGLDVLVLERSAGRHDFELMDQYGLMLERDTETRERCLVSVGPRRFGTYFGTRPASAVRRSRRPGATDAVSGSTPLGSVGGELELDRCCASTARRSRSEALHALLFLIWCSLGFAARGWLGLGAAVVVRQHDKSHTCTRSCRRRGWPSVDECFRSDRAVGERSEEQFRGHRGYAECAGLARSAVGVYAPRGFPGARGSSADISKGGVVVVMLGSSC